MIARRDRVMMHSVRRKGVPISFVYIYGILYMSPKKYKPEQCLESVAQDDCNDCGLLFTLHSNCVAVYSKILSPENCQLCISILENTLTMSSFCLRLHCHSLSVSGNELPSNQSTAVLNF